MFSSASIGFGWRYLAPGNEPVLAFSLCLILESAVWEVLSGREDREVSVVEHESQILLCWLREHEEKLLSGIGVRLVKPCP
jgi:hypothetical protein